MRAFHRPGEVTKRGFTGYTPLQEALWQAHADLLYASAYGFAHTRRARPGTAVDPQRVAKLRRALMSRADFEVRSRFQGERRAYTEEDLPDRLLEYLLQRYDAASLLEPPRP